METGLTTQQNVSDKELLMHLDNLGLTSKLNEGEKNTYLQIAKAFNLNPFKREIHVSTYGEQMSIITGYEVYIKRAERSGQLDGWDVKTEGKPEDNSLKAIITIYRKDRKFRFVHEVMYSEYVQKTNSGTVTKFWQKAYTMIKKVAISQGFRLCFSDELGGMPYTPEEMPEQNQTIDVSHVEVQKEIAPKFTDTTLDDLKKEYEEILEKTDVFNADEKDALLKSMEGKSVAGMNKLIKNVGEKIQQLENEIKNQTA